MNFRRIKITAGMTDEYEVISTNAPDCVIERQLIENSHKEENGIVVDNPYNVIQANGFVVKVLGCQYDFDEEKIVVDKEFDYYDYSR